MDFLNKNEKVYVAEEDQRDFMEKLKRDVEVGELRGAAPRLESHRGGCTPPGTSECPPVGVGFPTPNDFLVGPPSSWCS